MININQISQDDTPYPFIFKYRFPTIDFKFQNTGTATASLWRFVIEVIHAEVDISPTFDFHMNVQDNMLFITAINNGWGTAHDCQFQIDEPTLNQLFSEKDRQYTGNIESGEKREILTFTKKQVPYDQFKRLSSEFKDLYFPGGAPIGIYGIELEEPQAAWTCKDDKNALCTNATRVWIFDKYFLVQNGFEVKHLTGGGFPSDATYGAIIDASKGPHERVYPISRKILPGDVERFHIMVGSPTSCHLLLRFKFFIDKSEVIESEAFDIKIWNPRNSSWHYKYKDGAELKREIERQQDLVNGGLLSEWGIQDLKRLQEQLMSYPFTKKD